MPGRLTKLEKKPLQVGPRGMFFTGLPGIQETLGCHEICVFLVSNKKPKMAIEQCQASNKVSKQ